ncbi:MAG: hypothetical protein HOZ81_13530 [Streptomyces sp.]|nr:hypothetical protein [Streptomyces sp.]
MTYQLNPSSDAEQASTDAVQSGHAFPPEWGTPPGGQFSEERAAWVRARVAEQRALQRVRLRARSLRTAGRLHGSTARAQLMRRRLAPGDR